MRYHEITTETVGDTWETRNANHQRQQAKRAKLRTKLATTQATAANDARNAAAKRSRSNDRLRNLRRQIAQPPRP